MDTQTQAFQLVVLGAGSAGLSAVELAAQLGLKRVALVEQDVSLGGECLHSGCVPSKALLHAAHTFGTDPVRAWNHVRQSIGAIEQRSDNRAHVEAQGVRTFQGQATFIDPHTIQVGEQVLKASFVLIATGSKPSVPPIPGLDTVPYLTNESFFALESLPRSMTVIGGGPIGCELAGGLARLGVTVTLLQNGDRLLNRETPDVSEAVKRGLEAVGVRVVLNVTTKEVAQSPDGIIVRYENPNELETVAEALLIAAGRTPNVQGLALEKAGVTAGQAGIVVNDYLQTGQRHIYAAGDVTNSPKFTHLAAQQAGLALRNMLAGPFKRSTTTLSTLPAITFTTPEVARFGMDSDTARTKGLQVLRIDYADIDRAITDELEGFIEVVIDKKGMVLGATIVGERASELLSPLLVVARAKVPFQELATTMFAYPTLASGLNILASRYASEKAIQKKSVQLVTKKWR